MDSADETSLLDSGFLIDLSHPLFYLELIEHDGLLISQRSAIDDKFIAFCVGKEIFSLKGLLVVWVH